MAKSRNYNNANPDEENLNLALLMLESLKPRFQQLVQSPHIDSKQLNSLTREFITAALELFGQNSVQSKTYADWQAHPMYPFHTGMSDYELKTLWQKAYHSGAQSTLTEIENLIPQVTFRLQHLGINKPSAQGEVQMVLQICKRLPIAAKVLARRRTGKNPFEIKDEYDVQDLLNSIIRSYFKYAVTEEPISKLAGSASRADFAIEELGIIIETKYVHSPNEQDRIVRQFAEDQQFYSKWEHLKDFIYVVYGSEDLKDPELLDQLGGEKVLNGKRFMAHIVRC